IIRIIRGDIPDVRDNSQLEQIKALCGIMMECWTLDAIKRPSITQCLNMMSFLAWSVPSDRDDNHLPSSRSYELLHGLRWMHYKNGRMDEARRYFEQSSEIAKSMGDEVAYADGQHALGEVYYFMGEYSKAENAYIAARDSYLRIGHWIRAGQSIMGLADTYTMQREYSKAEDVYTEALNSWPRSERRGFAYFALGLGDVSSKRSEYSKAEDAYTKARDIFSEIGNQGGFTSAVRGLGSVYLERGEYSRAEEAYTQACDICAQIGEQVGVAGAMEELGGESSEAEGLYMTAREIYTQIGEVRSLAEASWTLSRLHRAHARYREAEQFVLEALAISRELGSEEDIAEYEKFLEEVRRLMET
ncbi:hypothetical protein FRC00_003803, partial [Tulasnella sp. 408]